MTRPNPRLFLSPNCQSSYSVMVKWHTQIDGGAFLEGVGVMVMVDDLGGGVQDSMFWRCASVPKPTLCQKQVERIDCFGVTCYGPEAISGS